MEDSHAHIRIKSGRRCGTCRTAHLDRVGLRRQLWRWWRRSIPQAVAEAFRLVLATASWGYGQFRLANGPLTVSPHSVPLLCTICQVM
jgi:hypothetical protein